jgi:hypothetical protein
MFVKRNSSSNISLYKSCCFERCLVDASKWEMTSSQNNPEFQKKALLYRSLHTFVACRLFQISLGDGHLS